MSRYKLTKEANSINPTMDAFRIYRESALGWDVIESHGDEITARMRLQTLAFGFPEPVVLEIVEGTI